jgi:hypothetical protein
MKPCTNIYMRTHFVIRVVWPDELPPWHRMLHETLPGLRWGEFLAYPLEKFPKYARLKSCRGMFKRKLQPYEVKYGVAFVFWLSYNENREYLLAFPKTEIENYVGDGKEWEVPKHPSALEHQDPART